MRELFRRAAMKASAFALVVGAVITVIGAVALAQSSSGGAAPHVAAAKAAAGTDQLPLFNQLCVPPPAAAPQPTGTPPARPQGPPPRSQWHAEPAKVFDNLYFLGMTEYTAWAVTTSDGIIVIDPLFDYSVEDEVVNGLTTLGLDPKRIRYVLVSHAHTDHVGGARLLQDRFGARVVMSAADWDLLAADPGSYPKPKKDVVAVDGQKLTLGDTTLTLHLTPGHTLGTISTIIPVKDNGRSHTAMLWGGTNFNWRNNGGARYITAERPATFWYQNYSSSARKMKDIAAKANADVLLSNHSNYDGTKTKLPALMKRKAGDAHPYVVGGASVGRFLTVADECAKAGPLW
jgi:metallo-beta-lactamase class B